jgi:hypothetical protein
MQVVRHHTPRLTLMWVGALAICVLLGSLTAAHHVTAVAHRHDRLTGALSHAHELAETHLPSTSPHLHGRQLSSEDAGACHQLTGPPQSPPSPSPNVTAQVLPAFVVTSPRSSSTFVAAGHLLSLAPKTSPPTRHG